jgi:CRP/FNR family transcriptional regulator, anaerobic regulatory protein
MAPDQGQSMTRRNLCSECRVRRSALCCALSTEQLAACNRIAYRKHYPAGRLICDVDQEDWFGNVISGVVKLAKALADGRQQIVELLFPSDFLGRPFRSGGGYAAEAASAVELCCFQRQQFESLMHEWPQLKQIFLERTLDEVDAAREWMLLLGRKSASEKVAALILLILRRMRGPGLAAAAQPRTARFDLPLSRTEMADYLGLRIETVSRQLARLREAGVIAIPRGRTVVVRDLAALERMAEVDRSRPSLCNSRMPTHCRSTAMGRNPAPASSRGAYLLDKEAQAPLQRAGPFPVQGQIRCAAQHAIWLRRVHRSGKARRRRIPAPSPGKVRTKDKLDFRSQE